VGRLALLAAAVILLCSIAPHAPTIPAPGLILWAWERPEDLRFIDTATTGVGYLAATLDLQADGSARFHVRQQPLRLPPNVALIAVVRIESPPRYVFPKPAEIAAGLVQIAKGQDVKALQVDYDARASERGFYRALLAELRKKTDLPIGITALASWCDGDRWVSEEPLSEAVPMFFRMGKGESKEMPINAKGCRSSIGLSTDEAWPRRRPTGLSENARIYIFNPHAWTKSDYEAVVRQAEAWK
jgi:hypothetical protein